MNYILRSLGSTFFYMLSFLNRKSGVTVLMYHRVSDLLPESDLNTPPDVFRQHMRYLKYNCNVVSVERLLEPEFFNEHSVKRQRPVVVLTFDDGYHDNYLNAYPILQEWSLPACFFLITDMIGTEQKRERYKHMPTPDMMGWEDAREMRRGGMTICAHTRNHPHLNLLGEKEQRGEILGSIEAVKKETGPGACEKIFCYPYGDRNEATRKILEEAGIQYAFTVEPGFNDGDTDLLALKRREVSGVDEEFDLRKKLAGAFDIAHSLKEKKRQEEMAILRK